jgi:acetyl-CoA carboxylase carboxyl transferase subunit beta
MSWLRKKIEAVRGAEKRELPDGVWTKCDSCGEIIYRKASERNLFVCDKCGYHFRISSRTYLRVLADEGSFSELFQTISSLDPLEFKDSKKYTDRVEAARKRTSLGEAVVTGRARIESIPCMLGIMDFEFLGGSMASAVGEKISRLVDAAVEERLPVVIVSTSGGARMQEGILSLMQMAKTSSAIARLGEEGIPFLSVLGDPTTGGVTASFASQGDVIIAEPKALIGFAGPRVIQQTINQDLPEGFQRAEFLLEHGMIDMVVPRKQLKQTVAKILQMLTHPNRYEDTGCGPETGNRQRQAPGVSEKNPNMVPAGESGHEAGTQRNSTPDDQAGRSS